MNEGSSVCLLRNTGGTDEVTHAAQESEPFVLEMPE